MFYALLGPRNILTSIGSYAAWLLARGEHQTDNRGKRNWNKEVIENMVADMKSPWDNLISDIRAEKVNMKQGVVACWEEAIAILGLCSPDIPRIV